METSQAPPAETPVPVATASRFLPVLLILFAASGCAALMYEIVWYQLLQMAIGSTAVSMGFLLATFMGGLCIGSLWLPRMRALGGHHPLRVYAAIEAGIGVFGVLVLWGLPYIARAYVSGFEHGLSNMLLRALIAAVCMLPSTILMGASLPAVSRWIQSDRQGVSWWGFLYGGNTLGAVFGCLFAGFYVLRIYNMATATYIAAAINLAIAAVSLLLAARTPSHTEPEAEPEQAGEITPGPERWTIYAATALSGATALGAEVVWTRLLGMLLGATVYAFAIILAVFLVGMALGSWVGAWTSRTVRPRLALGWSQILLMVGIAWTAFMIADSLPYWPINPLLTPSPWFTFQIDMARCLWAILPPAILWGASFPLALAAAAATGEDSGRLVGGIYAANTLGAIAGALGVSLILIPAAGTLASQRVLLAAAALSALLVLAPYVRQSRSLAMASALAVSLMLAGILIWRLDPIPGELIAYGRRMAISQGSKVLYTVEGRNSSVAITQWGDGAIEVDVNGHVEATTEPFDMKLQRMVGHLPALLHPNPKKILGIGFGAGVSAGTFTTYPGIESITICEIEPVVPPTSTKYFAVQDYDVMHNPRTRIIYDDARHFILTTQDKFDIIASDPLDVFVKGTAAIYSKEYFEKIKEHLNPGGFFTLYVPLYESDLRTVKSEMETFFAAFPNATIWANTRNGQGYDMVFMGQVEPLRVNLDELQQRLERPDYAMVAQSLRDIGVNSAVDLLANFAGQKSDLGRWSAGSELNTDADLRLQYWGGWGINSQLEDVIYRDMIAFRQPPGNLFTGSPERLQELNYAIGRQ